jgi:hypothetical protein
MKMPDSSTGTPALLLRAYGRTVSLQGPVPALEAAREWLPPTFRLGGLPPERRWAVCEHSATEWTAAVDDEVFTCRPSLLEATEAALSDLELWVAERARRGVFVHAGCVAVDGRAVVLPGRSLSGKSSLTAALLRAGADYYSDEYAVLDSQGLVHPYPRKLLLREHVGAGGERVAADLVGGRIGRGPARIKLIAALRFDPAAGWQSVPLTRGAAILRLLDNTVPARSRPRAVLSALEGATSGASAFEGTRGEADEAASRIMATLSG